MEDQEFRKAYKELFDGIKASDELKNRVLAGKRKKYDARPVIAAIGTIAAAVAIFAAVRGYDFTHSDDGIITETAITETAAPKKHTPPPVERNEEKIGDNAAENAEKPTARAETAEHAEKSTARPETAKSAEKPASAQNPAKRTTEDYMRKSPEIRSTAAPAKTQPAAEKARNIQQYAVPEPEATTAPEEQTVPKDTGEKNSVTDEEQEDSAAKTRSIERSFVPDASETGGQDGSLVIPFPTGPVTLRMNSQSVLAGLMYEASSASEETDTAEEFHTEKWDNQRYFDYLGIDIINSLKLSEDMKYSGGDEYYFAMDANGRLKNDTRIFTFTGQEDRFVSVLTSRDTTLVDSILSSPEVMKSNISGIQVAAFQPGQSYSFYTKSNDAAFIITTEKLDRQEIADLLFSLGTEQ